MSHTRMITVTLLALSLCLYMTSHGGFVSASDIQPSNQPPGSLSGHQQPQAPDQDFPSAPQQTSSGASANGANLIAQTNQQRLPKINIYISKNEIKKLLGIDTRINYVTNGNINTYPLGFTIPLGYNQSDIIFTWQNLGQTNVNYSISLVIGNIMAVDAPLINITRSGLIPKHEQVFKITLPCSGKVTDEVDVQVLINITGLLEEDPIGGPVNSGSLNSASSLFDSSPTPTIEAANASASSAQDSMQSDQASEQAARLVSHTLAIKRKKICTMHQVQVPLQPRQPLVQPQPQIHQIVSNSARQQHIEQTANRWDATQMQISSRQPELANSRQHQQSQTAQVAVSTHDQSASSAQKNLPPSGQQGSQIGLPTPSMGSSSTSDTLEASTRKLAELNLIPPQRPDPQFGPHHEHHHHNQQQSPAGRRSSLEAPQVGFYPNWPHQIGRLPLDNPLNDILAASNRQQAASNSSTSPLVLTLVGFSLLISIALIVVAILSSSSHRSAPLDKLGSLTSRILRRTPAHSSSSSSANKCKSPMAGTVIGSLRAGPKSGASSVSGLSAISGQSLSKAYCFKTNCTIGGTNSGYCTNANSQYHHHQQQHHYQHPPTADLLGTGYQCQPSQQAPPPPPPQYPIYHIATGSNSQTTRLIWNNGNGTSPDGFTIDGGSYMPLSNAPRSDSGSVYQTIY